jgi:hypothetical protein
MSFAVPALLGVHSGSPERRLVMPGSLLPPLSLLRTGVSDARATALGEDGASWQEFFPDSARFHGAARRLLIEGQRTNLISNARTVGGTGWINTGIASTAAVAGPNGGAASAIRLDEGAATSQHQTAHPSISVTSGLPYTFSFLVRAGTCTTGQIYGYVAGFGSTAFQNFNLATGQLGSGGANVLRAAMRHFGEWWWIEMTAAATATTSTQFAFTMTGSPTAGRSTTYAGTGRTLDVSWCWIEQVGFASTPALPPVGSPSVAARGADRVSAPLAALGVPVNGACTVLWSGVIPQGAPADADQLILQIDGGSDANCFRLRNPAGGTTLAAGRVTAGVAADAALGGIITSTPFRLGLALNGAGRIAASLNGGAPLTATGGPVSGLATLRLGGNAAGGASLFGETAHLRVLPRTLDDAALAAAVAALPT